MVKFLVLALFYGDHPALAQRCAASLRALWRLAAVARRAGREVPDELVFNTGGWKVVPLALMRRFDWPAGIRHAGGELGLAALLHQKGLQPEPFRVGLAINADDLLRESAAPRRGVTEPAHDEGWHIWGART